MNLKGKKIGFGITGSHCTLEQVIPVISELVKKKAEVFPIITTSVQKSNTRYGRGEEWIARIKEITGKDALKDIVEVEPFGPEKKLDAMLIAPCTGNTLAKLSGGIIDTAVLMAAKAQLRNQRPVILAVSTNDALGINLKSLAIMLNTKNVYLVPFYQDDPYNKPNSLVARIDLIIPTVECALRDYQIQPLLSLR